MLKNKKSFYLAIVFFFASIAINIPYPNIVLYDETVVLLNIPIKTFNGFNYVGITSFLLLIVSLYFLVKSLNKYHFRSVAIIIIVAVFLPSFLVSLYQKNFAKGIYSISYSATESHCSFKMINKATLHGECELPLKNNSRNDVQFTLEFYEPYQSQFDSQMVSLMNNNAPYKIMLRGKESKIVKIKANIDVSKMREHIYGGETTGGVNITIKSGTQSRNL